MNKFDRGMVKWQPFNSVINSKDVINSLLQEKEKCAKPILSSDEINLIEKKIIDALYCQNKITIHYYKNGIIKCITSKIKKIDYITKIIYLNNLKLYFNQIISID